MSIGMILHLLAQDRTMLIEALLGNILTCIVVYTLFGKRKYDWFFPTACAVRYIFYNIGLLSIWNAMYGTQNWYKITMSTCATATALILVIITAILWKEPLSKVMVGVFAAECINDGILYQGMKMKLPIIQECFLVVFIFTVLYFIVRPLLKKYRTYIIKHKVICLTLIFTFFIAGWLSNILYNTSASLHQKPMYLLATSLFIGGGIALGITFVIHTRSVFQKKKELKQNTKQMENYYQEIQNQIKELDDFKEIAENLEERYQKINQLFFCDDYLIDGLLADLATTCKQQNIETDILFQNYHRGNISREDSVNILLQFIEHAKYASKVKIHAAAIKNQLVYSVELKEQPISERKIKISPKDFKKYVKKYDGEVSIEEEGRTVRIILGLKR